MDTSEVDSPRNRYLIQLFFPGPKLRRDAASALLDDLDLMDRTLQEHIAYLEQKIEKLKALLADARRSKDEKVVLRIDLDMAERAINHYRRGLELEGHLSD